MRGEGTYGGRGLHGIWSWHSREEAVPVLRRGGVASTPRTPTARQRAARAEPAVGAPSAGAEGAGRTLVRGEWRGQQGWAENF